MVEELLRDGFAYHDTQSERFAGELEAAVAAGSVTQEHWLRLLNVCNHTIGEHMGDWPRARRLAERVLEGRVAEEATATVWSRLATARHMAGDPLAATLAEFEALKASDDIRGAYVEGKVNLAIALMGSGQLEAGASLYESVVPLADPSAPSAADRSLAVASNNLATDLLEVENRSPAQERLMVAAAENALIFWRKAGTWVNEERALYLKALVANAVGQPDESLAISGQALGIIAANGGGEEIDVCFLNLSRANAFGLKGEAAAHREALTAADAEAATWDDDGLKAWYAEERAKIRLI